METRNTTNDATTTGIMVTLENGHQVPLSLALDLVAAPMPAPTQAAATGRAHRREGFRLEAQRTLRVLEPRTIQATDDGLRRTLAL